MPGRLEVLGKLKIGCPGGACQSCPPGACPRRGRAWPLETSNEGTKAWSNFATYLGGGCDCCQHRHRKVHGACGTEAVSTDIIRPNTKFCPMYASCRFEGLGDVATLDVAKRARGYLTVCPQWRIMGSSMLA